MKNTTMTTLAALLLGSTGLFAVAEPTTAVTKPSGFVTHTLKAGKFNLIGLTLHEAVTVSGDFSDVTEGTDAVTLEDTDVVFTSVLTGSEMYILEIIESATPTLVGMTQEFNQWTDDTIITPLISGLAVGDKYQIRRATTISDVFGANNSAGLKASTNISGADVVWLVNSSNGFDKYYYSPGGGLGGGTPGWKDAAGADAGNPAVVYADAIFIQSRSSEDKDLVITGAVKVKGTALALTSGFNFVSSTFPVGATLDNAGLEGDLKQATNIASADVVWITNGSGGYTKYYFSPGGGLGGGTAGWKDASGADAVGVDLTSGLIIQRRGEPVNVNLSPPSSYNNL